MKFKILLLLIFYFNDIICETKDDCYLHTTCGECIGFAGNVCVWCEQGEMPDGFRRCIPKSEADLNAKWCNKTVSPESNITIVLNKEFRDEGDIVQLRPQQIQIKARPGVPIPFQIGFQPAKFYPLDIYYLMDISYSMKSSTEALQKQAQTIYTALTGYTNNVRLGLGSFVEKPAFPYVDDVKKKNPHIAFAFRNHLSLTTDVKVFENSIQNIELGANYDDQEAGLDALMQVMTCQDQLDWRKKAIKIIVLCTDSTYHSAGDGKVIGIIKPNDMKCHVHNNEYNRTMSLTYDYPSVSQINHIASNNSFIVVFAVKKGVLEDYKELAKHIIGARYAELKDGNDAVEIIKTAYLKAAESAPLNYNFPPFVELNLDPVCNSKTDLPSNCRSTPEHETVTTNAILTVKYCPPDGTLEHKLKINAVGYQDQVLIDLKILCKCDCEDVTPIAVSPKCNNAGVIQCGICKCNKGSYGVDCRCTGTSTSNEEMNKCYMNADDKKWCSGNGECRCGKCEKCNKGFSGNFCQFNDESCPRNDQNILCSGHGICTLGKCQCDSDYTDSDCSCLQKNDTCTAPYSEDMCSKNGVCKCGSCKCKQEPGGKSYSGIFCDTCDDCAKERCKQLEGYAVCNFLNNKDKCDDQFKNNNTIVTFLNKTEFNGPNWEGAQWCRKELENGSFVNFKYKYELGKLNMGIQDEAEMPNEANKYIAIGSAIGIALLIGIISLIVWKIMIDIHDKREYRKFIEEAETAGYQNVLYTPPTQQFRNPAFDNN